MYNSGGFDNHGDASDSVKLHSPGSNSEFY